MAGNFEGIKTRHFGIEIEMTGLTRCKAGKVVAKYFNTSPEHYDGSYLKWYAAFHDKVSNPHVHITVYSTDVREGFLTKEGIEKIRSVFANDIFGDDLKSIYQQQTLIRDEIKDYGCIK